MANWRSAAGFIRSWSGEWPYSDCSLAAWEPKAGWSWWNLLRHKADKHHQKAERNTRGVGRLAGLEWVKLILQRAKLGTWWLRARICHVCLRLKSLKNLSRADGCVGTQCWPLDVCKLPTCCGHGKGECSLGMDQARNFPWNWTSSSFTIKAN